MRLVMMSEVKPGDRVLSADGSWHPVTAVSTHPPKGRKITLTLWNGTSDLVLTHNHPVLTPTGFREAGTLTKGDKVLERIDRTAHNIEAIDMAEYMRRPKSDKRSNAGLLLGGTQVSEDGQFIRYKNPRATWVRRYIPVNADLMALTGFYAAEGSCGSHNLQFTFHSEELALHEEVDRLVRDLFGLTMTRSWSKEGKAVTLTVSSYPLRSFFREMVPGTAGKKSLSNVVLHAPVDMQREFLRTYWLGDGSTHANSFILTTTSRTLMLQVRAILLRANIVPSLSTSRRPGACS
jgi:intein/homing endonuclease